MRHDRGRSRPLVDVGEPATPWSPRPTRGEADVATWRRGAAKCRNGSQVIEKMGKSLRKVIAIGGCQVLAFDLSAWAILPSRNGVTIMQGFTDLESVILATVRDENWNQLQTISILAHLIEASGMHGPDFAESLLQFVQIGKAAKAAK